MSFLKIFHHIGKHALGSIAYGYGANFVLAGALTYAIILVGFDSAWHHLATIDYPWIYRAGFIGVMLGSFIPLFIPLGLYLYGLWHKNIELQIAGLATGQAAFLGLCISTFIKVFTGRLPPQVVTDPLISGFQFGFLEGGTFWGWPSSHTTVAFAASSALIALYPRNKPLIVAALIFALSVGLGVSTNIHWFSDFVAGAFIGYAIGTTAGNGFKKLL